MFYCECEMVYNVEILRLSNCFYVDYPKNQYPELLQKIERPYACLMIELRNYHICIPYRTHIDHTNSYRFKLSVRSKSNKSGLDFSKMAIVIDPQYIDKKPALIDKDEFNETMINIDKIVSSALKYVDTYIDHVSDRNRIHEKEFLRKYKYSTLPYFHRELGIEEVQK